LIPTPHIKEVEHGRIKYERYVRQLSIYT